MFILGAMVGGVISFVVFVFISGASMNNREHDAYMRGYEDGKKVGAANE